MGLFDLALGGSGEDGLAVATKMGEGQAQVLKPYDAKDWHHAMDVQAQREANAAKLGQERQEKLNNTKDKMYANLTKINDIHPKDRDFIEKQVKLANEKIKKFDGSAQQQAEIAELENSIGMSADFSRKTYDKQKAADMDYLHNGENQYYNPGVEDKYKQSIGVNNDATTAAQGAQKMTERAEAIDSFLPSDKKIKNFDLYANDFVSKYTPDRMDAGVPIDIGNGQIRFTTVPFYGAEKRKIINDASLKHWEQNPQVQAEYPNSGDWQNLVNAHMKTTEKETTKTEPKKDKTAIHSKASKASKAIKALKAKQKGKISQKQIDWILSQ